MRLTYCTITSVLQTQYDPAFWYTVNVLHASGAQNTILVAFREQQIVAIYFADAPEALTIHPPNQNWQDSSATASAVPSAPHNSAQGSLLTADSLEPHAMVDTPAESQGMPERCMVSHACHQRSQFGGPWLCHQMKLCWRLLHLQEEQSRLGSIAYMGTMTPSACTCQTSSVMSTAASLQFPVNMSIVNTYAL